MKSLSSKVTFKTTNIIKNILRLPSTKMIQMSSCNFENVQSSCNPLPKAKTKRELFCSPIRSMNIGKNYFKYINPRRKKTFQILFNSYIKQFNTQETIDELKFALDLYYNNELNGQPFEDFSEEDIPKISEQTLWHFYMIMLIDRMASQYSRYEFNEYHQQINQLNEIKKEDRNKAKYIFTAHSNQPNSVQQLKFISEVFKALEENDLKYLDTAMFQLSMSNSARDFENDSYLEQATTYHSICLPQLLECIALMYELGLRDIGEFIETPGTTISFEFDHHPEIRTGLMTYSHGLNLMITIDEYLKIIEEADCKEQMKEIIVNLEKVKEYGKKLVQLSNAYDQGKMSKKEFLFEIPMTNIYSIETKIVQGLNELALNTTNNRLRVTSKKLLTLVEIFKLCGCLGHIKLKGSDLKVNHESEVKEIIHDALREISILNNNLQAAEMIVIVDYENISQLKILEKLLKKYMVNKIQIVPSINRSDVENDTKCKVIKLNSSQTRQRDGLLFTEIRNLKEFVKQPDNHIYIGQGNTAERGGGPFTLTHQKYNALTKVQRKRHIRTIQGYYFATEFCSRDLIFTFLLNGAVNLNIGDNFVPTTDYLEFLQLLDDIVGKPQRELQKTKEFNDMYVNNKLIRTLVENFDYTGSNYETRKFENVKEESAVTQAYIFSDRCSYTHPELTYWDKLDEGLIKRMAKYYYDNNRHFKYVLYNYAFMLKRYDLDFAQKELGFNEDNPVFKKYIAGKKALEKIMSDIGLGPTSTPMIQIYNQHLGLVTNSSIEECNQKVHAYRMLYKLQNHYARRADNEKYLRRMKIIQSALANISPFNGKG